MHLKLRLSPLAFDKESINVKSISLWTLPPDFLW